MEEVELGGLEEDEDGSGNEEYRFPSIEDREEVTFYCWPFSKG